MTSSSIYAAEVFNFDVTEVEIIEEGNKFLGKNGGTATSSDGTVIKANNFEYDKSKAGDNSRFWIAAQENLNRDKKLRFFKNSIFNLQCAFIVVNF
mgnify:CR=1 FL=1